MPGSVGAYPVGVDLQVLALMAAYSFVTSVSPGPNNTILLGLAGRFGPSGARPHVVGMVCGLSSMVAAMSAGLGAFFVAFPAVYGVLKYVGFAYVLYMAWRIYHSAAPGSEAGDSPPTTVWRATLFQWVNPKAWIVIATFVTAYVPVGLGLWSIPLAVSVFIGFTMPGALVWVFIGGLLARVLRTPRSQKIFTTATAISLVASMVPVLFL
jgi:threonine/homoserine/homoserine lactone efflux protein